MAVWKVQALTRVSAVTGEPLPPDTDVVTALFGEDEEVGEDRVRGTHFVRKDFLKDEATEDALAGAFCIWQTRTPPEKPQNERRLDLGMAREFLERLLDEGNRDRDAVCMTLALLLIRKRKLNLVEQREGAFRVRWPRDDKAFEVPAPEVTEADAEVLQQELTRLFDVA